MATAKVSQAARKKTKTNTAPHEMDGSSRLKQHDNVHQQIAAFEKLLQHAINRFSAEKLHQMMQLVISSLPFIPRPKHAGARYSAENGDQILSLAHVREIVAEFKNANRRGIEKDEETHVVRYFDTFFEDIAYLKSLKHYFDQKVYICLYEYFYDPEDDTLDPRAALEREKKGHVTAATAPAEKSDEGKHHQPGSGSEDGQDESEAAAELEFYFDKLTDKEKLSMAVRKMFEINTRWHALFEDDYIDERLFDPDSRHEMLHFSNHDQFKNVLRLVPDLFVKAYKSIELAKLWWTQANKIYDVLPQAQTRKRTEKEINERIVSLERKLSEIRDEIRRHEELLVRQTDELERLTGRENRYLSLSSECEQLEGRKNDTGDKFNRILAQRNQLKDSLDELNPYSLEYQEKHEELKEWERKFFDAQVELRMLTFQFRLTQSDFLVELQIRPDLIRFQTDIETKIQDTQVAIMNKTGEERDSEKRLTLLKTNCERMRVVMKRVLKTQDNSKDASSDHKQRLQRKERKRDALDKTNNKNNQEPDGNDARDKETRGEIVDERRKLRKKKGAGRTETKKNRDKTSNTAYDRHKTEPQNEDKDCAGDKAYNGHVTPARHLVEDDLTTDDGNLADTDTSTPILRAFP